MRWISLVKRSTWPTLIFILLALLAYARDKQITIDATTVSTKIRKITSGHGGGGSFVKALPLQITLRLRGPSQTKVGYTEVEFTLTNSGSTELTVPASPNSKATEALNGDYTDEICGLQVKAKNDKEVQILAGGADLYGTPRVPDTLIRLSPGESIRVLANVKLPLSSTANKTTPTFSASIILQTETIKTEGNSVSSDMQEIGFATSKEYRLEEMY